MAKEQDIFKKWSQLIAQAWTDDQLKNRLITKPAAVLQEHGIDVPSGLEVRVVENTDTVYYLTLPPKPMGDVTELTSAQMSGVVGGAAFFSCSCLCSCVVAPSKPGTGAKPDIYEDRD
jgi:Nitrile hydratase, alpha chain